MVRTQVRFTHIEDYAALETSDLPEGPYELVDGVIVEMGAENLQNVEIAGFLFSVLLQFVSHYLIHRGTEIQVHSPFVTARFPDVMVLSEATRSEMPRDRRSLITLEMPPPVLVVEIVSPGNESSENYQRDYVHKPQEYAQRGIPEYWLIDPSRVIVRVFHLEAGEYRDRTFQKSDRILSPTFPDLQLTATQILNARQ